MIRSPHFAPLSFRVSLNVRISLKLPYLRRRTLKYTGKSDILKFYLAVGGS